MTEPSSRAGLCASEMRNYTIHSAAAVSLLTSHASPGIFIRVIVKSANSEGKTLGFFFLFFHHKTLRSSGKERVKRWAASRGKLVLADRLWNGIKNERPGGTTRVASTRSVCTAA